MLKLLKFRAEAEAKITGEKDEEIKKVEAEILWHIQSEGQNVVYYTNSINSKEKCRKQMIV